MKDIEEKSTLYFFFFFFEDMRKLDILAEISNSNNRLPIKNSIIFYFPISYQKLTCIINFHYKFNLYLYRNVLSILRIFKKYIILKIYKKI